MKELMKYINFSFLCPKLFTLYSNSYLWNFVSLLSERYKYSGDISICFKTHYLVSIMISIPTVHNFLESSKFLYFLTQVSL